MLLRSSLIAKLSEFFDISPGQLTPPAWRTLIAIQNLGDLEGLMLGLNEVLYSYSISTLPGSEGKYYLRPRGKKALVQEIEKKARKNHHIFVKWEERFTFALLPGYPSVWHVAGRLNRYRFWA